MTGPIRLRGELQYDIFQGIRFDGFLPFEEGSQTIPLSDTGFSVKVFMDPTRHKGWIVDLDLGRIKDTRGMTCAGLFIQLETEVTPSLMNALEGQCVNGETQEFGQRALSALQRVHDILVDFARNASQQFWLRPRTIVDAASLQEQRNPSTSGVGWDGAETWRAAGVA